MRLKEKSGMSDLSAYSEFMNTRPETLVLAFPGTGKTYVAKHYENAADSDDIDMSPTLSSFSWLVSYYAQQGRNVTMAPFGSYSLAVHAYQWETSRLTFNTILAYPSKDCLDEYVERYKQRGNGEQFISTWIGDFKRAIEIAEKFKKFEHQKIVLKPGQYLAQALMENGVYLQPRTTMESGFPELSAAYAIPAAF
ncbi:MAG: hypothetical protein LBJ21_08265 [Acidobacteriota bacterium]|nr:hypothetical protein [Acidobacteriota bacterium]